MRRDAFAASLIRLKKSVADQLPQDLDIFLQKVPFPSHHLVGLAEYVKSLIEKLKQGFVVPAIPSFGKASRHGGLLSGDQVFGAGNDVPRARQKLVIGSFAVHCPPAEIAGRSTGDRARRAG